MRKGILIFFICMVLVACSHAPYHVELDSLSREKTVEKYGEGTHYFIYTRHKFESNEDSEGFNVFFRDVGAYIQENLPNYEGCKIIRETLSYYSEGGNVSVLVICQST